MISGRMNQSTINASLPSEMKDAYYSAPSKQFWIRGATKDDFPAIRNLIDLVGINPMGLDWQRFSIAVDKNDNLVGCGQVNGSLELASIAVHPDWRKLGVATSIIHHLLITHPKPIYLVCKNRLRTFYENFGFVNITNPKDMPTYFRWLYLSVKAIQRLGLIDVRLLRIGNILRLGVTKEPSLVMRRQNS